MVELTIREFVAADPAIRLVEVARATELLVPGGPGRTRDHGSFIAVMGTWGLDMPTDVEYPRSYGAPAIEQQTCLIIYGAEASRIDIRMMKIWMFEGLTKRSRPNQIPLYYLPSRAQSVA